MKRPGRLDKIILKKYLLFFSPKTVSKGVDHRKHTVLSGEVSIGIG